MYLNHEQLNILDRIISEHNLDAYRDSIIRLTEPCFRLTPTVPDDPRQIGSTRFGGTPDLPPDLNWPQKGFRFLIFLAQIRLRELPFSKTRMESTRSPSQTILFDSATYDSLLKNDQLLPSDGMLYFFLGETTNYDDIEHKVIYLPEADCVDLRPTLPPPLAQYVDISPRNALFPAYRVATELAIGFPTFSWNRLDIATDNYIGYNVPLDTLLKMEQAIRGKENDSRFWGYPYPPDRVIFWNLYRHEGLHYRNHAEFEHEFDQWLLLFELFSHRKTKMHWGDSGRLYFMIHRSDLKNRDFTRTFAAGFSH